MTLGKEGWKEALLLDELQSTEFRSIQSRRLGYGIVKSLIKVCLKITFRCLLL